MSVKSQHKTWQTDSRTDERMDTLVRKARPMHYAIYAGIVIGGLEVNESIPGRLLQRPHLGILFVIFVEP